LRRAEAKRCSHLGQELNVADLRLDLDSYRVFTKNQPISLGPKEFQLLRYLMSTQGRVPSRQQLLDHGWGVQDFVVQRTVDVHVLRLRKQLAKGECAHFLQKVRGVGYCFPTQE
jgi:two-component system phosphate regulon response regulator PhoB